MARSWWMSPPSLRGAKRRSNPALRRRHWIALLRFARNDELRRDAGQAGERHGELAFVIVLVDQLAFEIGDIGAHVEMAVAGHVEQNDLGLALFLAAQCLVDGATHRMRRLRRRYDALAAGELHAGVEAGFLVIGARLDQAEI